ncbi:sirohydrochlorin chelatase [Rubinisphaera margarita]|uniref:sirohydrochlorin chelatase n=1 Tax=Rubinisphaera margarita TaxID=2909586 RepID=UPI001EE7A9CC|nr:CbiX/SirB N-terminal domain-containing protein [Rubinisphaera margarita]MCG6155740.1 CbiX/SirB N-terminal domain-containing protein [Rubinisphaera margarita]
MASDSNRDAILLIAHGSRRQQANDDLFRLKEMVQESRPGQIVECSFLELAEPTIPQGAEACVAAGADRVLMFPYFLSAGTHVANDLTEFRDEFSQRWPDVEFKVCSHLGLHPLMVQIVFDRIAAAE